MSHSHLLPIPEFLLRDKSPDYVKDLIGKNREDGEGGFVMNVPFDNGFVDNLDNFKSLNIEPA